MILTTTNNETIIFKIISYEFDNYDNEHDANWLCFYIRFIGKDENWEEFDPGITTLNLISLKNWFLALAENKLFNDRKIIDFLDCNLAFELLNSETDDVKQLGFTSVKNKQYTFLVSKDELIAIVRGLEQEIRSFPERTVGNLSSQPTVYHYPLFLQTSIQMEPHDLDPYNLIIPKAGELPTDKAQTPQNLSVSILLGYSVLDSKLLEEQFFILERELETILSESFNAILPIAENGFVQYIDFKNHSFVQHFEVVIADKFTKNIQEIYRDKIRINNLELKVINAVDK